MAKWSFTRTASLGGRFQIIITKNGYPPTDVTMLRGVPTLLDSYASADPFGDATAQLTFPQLSGFEDLDSADVGCWLGDFSDVDIWWVPALATTPGEGDVLSPLTNAPDAITPLAVSGTDARIKVWEGFIASIELSAEEDKHSISVQCQGALFQLDRYLQKPFYPPRPQPLEAMIKGVFDKGARPHLRTAPLVIAWPAGWTKVAPPYTKANTYTPKVAPGSKWSGYASRSTGAWDRALTGYCQDLLAVMLTQPGCGVPAGDQWTITQRRAGAGWAGRTPVLGVRARTRPSDFTLWLGTPGLSCSLTRDTTQVANIIYGDGTGLDGTVWRNAVISADGSRTDYAPLAAAAEIWPYANNKQFSHQAFAAEAYLKYGTGFDQDDAITSAEQTLARDRDPGWSGTLKLRIDPTPELPRFLVRAGMTVRLQGLAGTGSAGLAFHIAEVNISPADGSVTCKIDTRYRDLLNLDEALVRTRDPLTPSKLLQVNRASVLIEDIMAPWDYTAGSGFVPKASVPFHRYKPATQPFPWASWALLHPPFHFPQFYVRVNANAATRRGRWTGPVPILASEKGSIRHSEFACYDKYGRVLKIPFHISIYQYNVTVAAMPYDGLGPSPYINNAFEPMDPATGLPWPTGYHLPADPSILIGWGNRQVGVYQRAGFSPGRESDGDSPTGLLVDDADWNYDNTFQNVFKGPLLHPVKTSEITIHAMFYAEHSEPVYFMGRLYRAVPGTG